MMSMLRMSVLGAGAAGAAGVAVFAPPLIDQQKTAENAAAVAGGELCLKSDLVMFEGVTAQCYSRDELRALLDRPLVNRRGDTVTVSMTHPSDMSVAPAECKTCRDFRELSFDGWYAASSRDMRREGYFTRACGVLAALAEAQPAKQSYFDAGSPSSEQVAAMAAGMEFGELRAGEADIHVERDSGQIWRITAGPLNVQFREIANADFDNDGVEEILTFSASTPEEGTASFYEVGLMEMDSAGSALRFTPLSFGRNEAGGVGG